MAAADDGARISVIVPALNEAEQIGETLDSLQPMRERGHEIILVDGGSQDATISLAAGLVDQVIESASGRARQMNAGAQCAAGDVFWFLHADTRVPADADARIIAALRNGQRCWGRFDVELRDRSGLLRIVAFFMNLRSRLSGIATGDQGMFMTRTAFHSIGGFDDIPIMEDIDASRALGQLSRPLALRATLSTSARRWRSAGIVRTILTMWALRLAYFSGVPAGRLARYYRAHGG